MLHIITPDCHRSSSTVSQCYAQPACDSKFTLELGGWARKCLLVMLGCSWCVALGHGAGEVSVPPYRLDFDELALGSIDGQLGWKVEQGKAEVVKDVAFSGTQSLRLTPHTPFSQARLSLAVGQMPQPVMFIDFRLRPVASVLPEGGPGADELLDVDGARIGLFRSKANDPQAELWVFNGDGSGGGAWVNAAVSLKVDGKTGRAADWSRLTLRQDFNRQTWDLFVDGRLQAAALGFQESPLVHTAAYILMGDLAQAIYLDDLLIQSGNPLAEDADGDGISDVSEKS